MSMRYDQGVCESLGGQFGGSRGHRQRGLPHQPIHREDVKACFPSHGGGEFISRALLDDDFLKLLLVKMVNRALATATATLGSKGEMPAHQEEGLVTMVYMQVQVSLPSGEGTGVGSPGLGCVWGCEGNKGER